MPIYVYEAVDDSQQVYQFMQKIEDEPFQHHPETGLPIRRIIVPGAGIRRQGLKRSTRVNKKSPAATACGCAKKIIKPHATCAH